MHNRNHLLKQSVSLDTLYLKQNYTPFSLWTPDSLQHFKKISTPLFMQKNVKTLSKVFFPSSGTANKINLQTKLDNTTMTAHAVPGAIQWAQNGFNDLAKYFFNSEAAKFATLMLITPPTVAVSVSAMERKQVLSQVGISSELSMMSLAYWRANWSFFKKATQASYVKNTLNVTGNSMTASSREVAAAHPRSVDSVKENVVRENELELEMQESEMLNKENTTNKTTLAGTQTSALRRDPGTTNLKYIGALSVLSSSLETVGNNYFVNKKIYDAIGKPMPALNSTIDWVKFAKMGCVPRFQKNSLNTFLIFGMESLIKEPVNRLLPSNHYPVVSWVVTIFISGVIAGVSFTPLEVINKRMVAGANDHLMARAMWDVTREVITQQGYKGLWVGAKKSVPIAMGAYGAFQLGFMGVGALFTWGQNRYGKTETPVINRKQMSSTEHSEADVLNTTTDAPRFSSSWGMFAASKSAAAQQPEVRADHVEPTKPRL